MALSGGAFPSPAAEYLEPVLDLQQFVVSHPAATFYAKAVNDIGEGVFQGDILVIDRAQKAQAGNLVLSIVDGHFKLLRLKPVSEKITVWGVVIYVLHKT